MTGFWRQALPESVGGFVEKAIKVFVSHASEDKDRFVLHFASRLRQNGIDAWVDKWEILPGDSLIDKIFEDGLKEAAAVIIVLSKSSVAKPWVREELNASMVKKIQTQSRIIPIVIDECEIPECLRSTVWERIHDLNNYDLEFNRILKSIFGHYERPPLGNLPAFRQKESIAFKGVFLRGLSHDDALVLRASCEVAITKESSHIEPREILNVCQECGLHSEEIEESLEVMQSKGYIKTDTALGGGIFLFQITTNGFSEYAHHFIPDWDGIQKRIGIGIINNIDSQDHNAIANRIGLPPFIVEMVLKLFEQNGWLRLSESLSGPVRIFDVSVQLRRWIKDSE